MAALNVDRLAKWPQVRAAKQIGDVAALSAMGRKGGKVCGAKRQAEKLLAQQAKLAIAKAEAAREEERKATELKKERAILAAAEAEAVRETNFLEAVDANNKLAFYRDARAHKMRNLAGSCQD